ncbi:hypothetical protein QYE76_020421 [Lolium multiflorum]|uniref:Myb-like domain-containing protein n=1 Tax=Lolium multiflorum TaxID=4521 RepID=A0AAD8R7P7_LOLMU|nr:hypothetical protein QYE76_020421 [Lolium multiflorum]
MRLKGMPLWEEVSAGMRGMGYHRSSQRCMEKWGNMNYYFKKMKDISKTRPSYFHQLEALGSSGSGGGGKAASSSPSLWPKAEVQALIQLRTSLGMRGKGSNAPLWEEVSAGMRRMGYSRSSKLCKAKWWQMNYYFDKVKDKGSNKKRPDGSRTGPFYFHQLEAFHRNKEAVGSPAGAGAGDAANAALRNGIGWSNLDMLWEGVSAGEGWSTKECMEKWNRMNYHFKNGVKGSNRKRPEESKAGPSYFHKLEALCRNKAAIGCPAGSAGAAAENANAAPPDRIEAFAVAAPLSQTAPQPYTLPPMAKNGVTITNNKGSSHDFAGVSRGTQMQASTGGNVAGNRFVLPKLPVRRSTISVKAEVEEFLKGFTDVVA